MNEELICGNIRKLRKKQEITLEKLAELTGLTKGYLSKVERSKKAPPYSTLNRIALALGVDAAFLLGENLQDSEDNRLSFTKKDQRKPVQSLGSLSEGSLFRYAYEALASDKPGKNMEPFILEPTFDEEAVFQHDGEEFMFVLEGRHELVYCALPLKDIQVDEAG